MSERPARADLTRCTLHNSSPRDFTEYNRVKNYDSTDIMRRNPFFNEQCT